MRLKSALLAFLNLTSVALGQASNVAAIVQPWVSTSTHSVQSAVEAANAAAAAATANEARQRAIDAAIRAMRRQYRDAAAQKKRNVVPLPKEAAQRWSRLSTGAWHFRDGQYEAVADHLGYRLRVIQGPKQFATPYFANLDAAIDQAVRWSGNKRPNIPGSLNFDEDLKRGKPPVESLPLYAELVWDYGGNTDEGDSWKDSTGTFTIVRDGKTDLFSVAAQDKTVAERLDTIDDAIEAAQRYASKHRTRLK